MIILKIDKIVKFFAIVITFLILASVSGQIIKYLTGYDFVFGFIPKFNLDKESNIPTFYSAIMLFVSGALLMCIAKMKKDKNEKDVFYWILLSYIFFYLSFDEASSLHELLIEPLRELCGASGVFYYAWIIPAIVLFFAFFVCFFKFYLRLDVRTKKWFFLAGVLYITGALGFEMVGGWYAERMGEDFTYNMITTLEETLEMVGVVVFIFALFDYLNRFSPEVVIRINKDS